MKLFYTALILIFISALVIWGLSKFFTLPDDSLLLLVLAIILALLAAVASRGR